MRHLANDFILYKHGYTVIKADFLADAMCVTKQKLIVMLKCCAKALPLRRTTFFNENNTYYVTKDGIIQLLLGDAVQVEEVHQRIINIVEALNEFEDKIKPPLSHELKIIIDLCKMQADLKEQLKQQFDINKELSKALVASILTEDSKVINNKSKKKYKK